MSTTDLTIIDPRAEFLKNKQHNVTSQNGEDGLIAALFEKVGATSKWCFEVGAGDGVYLSNTKALRDQGWCAVLIEADDAKYAKLDHYASNSVTVMSRAIDPVTLNDCLLASDGIGYDLGVIDIDGQDFWVWAGLDHKPRVMLVEHHCCGAGSCDELPPLDPASVYPKQAGLNWMVRLAECKGYTPLLYTQCNLLCMANEVGL